jgi:hypothetical protein
MDGGIECRLRQTINAWDNRLLTDIEFAEISETTSVLRSNDTIASMADKQLTAKYVSPDSSESFSQTLPSLSKNHDVKAKTEHLSALRTGIVQMQADVNAFLTKKMEEEKASQGQASKSKEDKEEEMYGEEDPEA